MKFHILPACKIARLIPFLDASGQYSLDHEVPCDPLLSPCTVQRRERAMSNALLIVVYTVMRPCVALFVGLLDAFARNKSGGVSVPCKGGLS